MARAERCRKRFAEYPAILMPAKSVHGVERHLGQPMATQTSQQETGILSTGMAMFAHRHNGDGQHLTRPMDTVTATEDANAFTPANLAQYETVVFLNTTGDVLNATQQTAFESYVRGGGGYAGVYAAADTEYDWPFYGELVGAYFDSHPAIQPATIRTEDRGHAATAHLPQAWNRTDEWYNYRTLISKDYLK